MYSRPDTVSMSVAFVTVSPETVVILLALVAEEAAFVAPVDARLLTVAYEERS